MKKIAFFLGLLLLFASAYPQSCITDEHYRNQVQQFPALKQAELNFNNAVFNSPSRSLGKAGSPNIAPGSYQLCITINEHITTKRYYSNEFIYK